jgi:protein TonB
MDASKFAVGFCSAAILTACSSTAPAPAAPAASPAVAIAQPAPTPFIPPLTREAYKKAVAERIAQASPDIFGEPLPEMFKSIVVLDITIDREGRLAQVSVRRSNGYQALEKKAVDSVRRAAPFMAPAFTVRGRDGTVNFLETFLFREDGRYQIRSLVAER